MENYNDEVILQGKIIQKVVTEKMASLVIQTTSATKDRSISNCPRVIFFSNLDQVNRFDRGDYVRVTGSLQNYIPKQDSKMRQSIVANSITEAKTPVEQEFGIKSSGSFHKENEVKLAGLVLNVVDHGSLYYIYLRTVVHGRSYILLAKAYKTETNSFVAKLKHGQQIYLIGTIQTKYRTGKEERRIYFEDLIAMDISLDSSFEKEAENVQINSKEETA